MYVVTLLTVLGVLIFVHELGHFMAAKSVDIRVDRFAIGLGPKIFGFQRGETEYIVGAIPLGGYVKMGGMDDEVMDQVEGGQAEIRPPSPRDFDAKPLWARAWVISAGVIMNFLFAFATYTFIAGNWGDGRLDTRQLGVVQAETLPAGAESLTELPIGSEVVRVGNTEIGYWDEIAEALIAAPAGPLTVYTEQPTASATIELGDDQMDRIRIAGSLGYWLPATVALVVDGSPADDGGLRAGDQVVSIDGVDIATWHELFTAIRAKPDSRMELGVERDGQRLVRALTPEAVTEVDRETGEETTFGRAGINSAVGEIPIAYSPVGFASAVAIGWDQTVWVTGQILGFLRDLVTGQVSPRNVGSIVAIGDMSSQAAAEGLPMFLGFMAMFSVNLAILNLLPIPVLDGGHLLFLMIEAVRGRALSVEQRVRWSQVGLVVLLGIMILALSNDVRRLFSRFFDA